MTVNHGISHHSQACDPALNTVSVLSSYMSWYRDSAIFAFFSVVLATRPIRCLLHNAYIPFFFSAVNMIMVYIITRMK